MKRWKILVTLGMSTAVCLCALGQCCPAGGGKVAVGFIWCFPNEVYLSGRFWLNEAMAVELDVLEPIFRGATAFRVKLLYVPDMFANLCSFRPYVGIGLSLPIGTLNWQRFDLWGGVEWCWPSNPEIAINVEATLSLLHYYHCTLSGCGWKWAQQGFMNLGGHYYLSP